jgi:hypothetical protein
MRGFIQNCKGAVTVFVTLLLIPAILVTGTGVDLARLYTARSTVRDANQLAANSALASYDALLQDLYGLFAVMQSDDDLAAMLDTYIRASLFGEEITDAQMGEFRLFWGSEGYDFSIRGFEKLSNTEVLRRQIEEYAKWRAPVAIVSDILDRLKDNPALSTADADAEVLRDKDAIDTQMEDIIGIYQNIYNEIVRLDEAYNELERQVFTNVNTYMNRIATQFGNLRTVRTNFQSESDPGRREDLENHYIAIQRNIENIVSGTGTVGSNWRPARFDDDGNLIEAGRWGSPNGSAGIGFQRTIENNVAQLQGFQSQFNKLISLSQQADQAKGRLEIAINNLETKLSNESSFTEGLPAGIREDLTIYKELLRHNYHTLSTQFRDHNMQRINNGPVRILNDIQAFGRVENNQVVDPRVSFSNLRSLVSHNIFPIDYSGNAANDLLSRINGASRSFSAPGSFVHFRDVGGAGDTAHRRAYDALRKIPGFEAPSSPEEREREDEGNRQNGRMMDEFRSYMRTLSRLTGMSNPTEGADSYSRSAGNRPTAYSTSTGGLFGIGFDSDSVKSDDRDGSFRAARGLMNGSHSLSNIIGTAMNNLTNKVLLVTYCNNMFTNWTTNYPVDSDNPKPKAISMSGHEFSPQINYFYRSELEYLIAGHDNTAANLRSVAWMILSIRIIANLTASYAIKEVREDIRLMKLTVAAIPVAGKFLKWLVRPFYVLCESINDLKILIEDGKSVALAKTNSTWEFRIFSVKSDGGTRILPLYYRDYLTIFLLFDNSDRLAVRAGNLVMLNVTNNRHNIGKNNENRTTRSSAMEALPRADMFDFSRANTSFEVTTTTYVHFLFLSQFFAQNERWVNARPPRTFPIVQTDYRGY